MSAKKIDVSDEDRIAFMAHAEEIAQEWRKKYGRGIGVRRIYYRLRGVSWSVVQPGANWARWVKDNLKRARRRWLTGDRGPLAIDPDLFSEERRQIVSWSSDESVEAWAKSLRRYDHDHWADQPHRVLVVCEKDGLAGLVEKACMPFRVDYVCTNGNASITVELKVQRKLEEWSAQGLDPHLLYVGDHDVSGVHMDVRWIENIGLEDDALERVAITLPQAEALGLEFETVDPNEVRYSEAGNIDKSWRKKAQKYVDRFGEPGATTAKAIELDMIDEGLEELISEAIEQYIDSDTWNEHREAAKEPRKAVDALLKQLREQTA